MKRNRRSLRGRWENYLEGLEAQAISSRPRATALYLIRLVRETAREFARDNCLLRATALSYQTLISLVPLIVLMLAIGAQFGPRTGRETAAAAAAGTKAGPAPSPAAPVAPAATPAPAGQPEEKDEFDPIEWLVNQIPFFAGLTAEAATRDPKLREIYESRLRLTENLRTYAKNASRAAGSLGLLTFIFVVILMLRSIEKAFNAIWSIEQSRPLFWRMAVYTTILFWGPILVAGSFSLTAVIHATSAQVLGRFGFLHSWFIEFAVPMLMTFAALLVLYMLMPNIRVRFRAALVGAFLAALGFEVAKHLFQFASIWFTQQKSLYGNLSIIPLLFLWFYIAWVLVLFGVEVSFTIQNFEDLTRKEERRRRSLIGRVYYAVRTVFEICRRFAHSQGPQPVDALAERFDIPQYVLRGICSELEERQMITAVAGEELSYLPARAVTELTIGEVIRALEGEPLRPAPVRTLDATHEVLGRRLNAAVDGLIENLNVTFDRLIEEVEEHSGPAGVLPTAADTPEPSPAPQTARPEAAGGGT